jgi:excisionase family DNA binding protein
MNHNNHGNVPTLLVRPKQACSMLSVGLTRLYELLNSGTLESFKDGKARKITVRSIEEYVDKQVGDAR